MYSSSPDPRWYFVNVIFWINLNWFQFAFTISLFKCVHCAISHHSIQMYICYITSIRTSIDKKPIALVPYHITANRLRWIWIFFFFFFHFRFCMLCQQIHGSADRVSKPKSIHVWQIETGFEKKNEKLNDKILVEFYITNQLIECVQCAFYRQIVNHTSIDVFWVES